MICILRDLRHFVEEWWWRRSWQAIVFFSWQRYFSWCDFGFADLLKTRVGLAGGGNLSNQLCFVVQRAALASWQPTICVSMSESWTSATNAIKYLSIKATWGGIQRRNMMFGAWARRGWKYSFFSFSIQYDIMKKSNVFRRHVFIVHQEIKNRSTCQVYAVKYNFSL